jgi:hypothetical protein
MVGRWKPTKLSIMNKVGVRCRQHKQHNRTQKGKPRIIEYKNLSLYAAETRECTFISIMHSMCVPFAARLIPHLMT